MPESKSVIWRRLLPASVLAGLVVVLNAIQDYRREGAFTTANVGATISTLLLLAIILSLVVWHATRRRRSDRS